MAVTIVQSQPGEFPGTNLAPSLAFPTRTTIGNVLFSLCGMVDPGAPSVPTDTQGNAWQAISSIVNLGGVAIGSAYVSAAAAHANDTVSLTTTGASQLLIAELGNVLPAQTVTLHTGPVTLPRYDAVTRIQGVSGNVQIDMSNAGPHGSLAFVLLAIQGNPTVTLNTAGWTALGNGSIGTLTYHGISQSTLAPGTLTANYTLGDGTVALPWAVYGVSFPSA